MHGCQQHVHYKRKSATTNNAVHVAPGLEPYEAESASYSVSYRRDPFEFTVSRADVPIFDTSGQRLILKVSLKMTWLRRDYLLMSSLPLRTCQAPSATVHGAICDVALP